MDNLNDVNFVIEAGGVVTIPTARSVNTLHTAHGLKVNGGIIDDSFATTMQKPQVVGKVAPKLEAPKRFTTWLRE